jgi:hypothetical protein
VCETDLGVVGEDVATVEGCAAKEVLGRGVVDQRAVGVLD